MANTTTRAAIYLRLSREDGDGESCSISNQRQLLTGFVSDRTDLSLGNEYVDDGFSGFDFNRPDFKRMLGDVKNGSVRCIVVKDFSRLGRNFQKTEEYIQRTFPKYGVRFISVNDCYDSSKAKKPEENITIPMKNLLNEYHVSETSVKVRTVLENHRRNGKFIGNHAPYGYRIENKSLVPDPDAAENVRKIFRLKISGISNQNIADWLNGNGIASPLEHKLESGIKATGEHLRKGDKALWSSVTVRRILENPVYIGTLIQGKTTSNSYRDKRRFKKSEAEVHKTENAHEAIISEMEFLIVEDLLSRDSYTKSGHSYLYSAFVFCANCGERLYYRCDNAVVSWHCRNKACSCKGRMREDILTDTVFATLKTHIDLILNAKNLDKAPDLLVNITQADDKIRKLLEEINHFKEMQNALVLKKNEGIISIRDFEAMMRYYDEKIAQNQYQVSKNQKDKERLHEHLEEIKSLYRKYCEAEELSREMLVTFVDRIEIFENEKVRLHLRYSNLFGNGGDHYGA